MMAFEVSKNGKQLYTMGAGDGGYMQFMMHWMQLRCEEVTIPERAGAIGVARERDHIGSWPAIDLKVGDEISVRIIETDSYDDPAHRQPLPTFDPTLTTANETTTNVYRVRYDPPTA